MKVIILFAVALLCVNAIKFKEAGTLDATTGGDGKGKGTAGEHPCDGLCKGCDPCKVCVDPNAEGKCPDWCEEKCMDCAMCHGHGLPVGGADLGHPCDGVCDGCDACEVCVNPTMEG
jgi:hypothetical protein